MKKIPSLFKRNYDGDRLVRDEVVEGCQWVLDGEGVATEKFDGTACRILDGVLYKRYDRRLIKAAARRKRKEGASFYPAYADFKTAPRGWMPSEEGPNRHTGHWPGWLEVDFDKPENKWHKEAWDRSFDMVIMGASSDRVAHPFSNATCELVGSKVQGNPYGLFQHELWLHGFRVIPDDDLLRAFETIGNYLSFVIIEGIVWHHPVGRMCKIKRRDFGFDWPI